MAGDGGGKRLIKINDFKVPVEWHLMVKTASNEDRRTIAQEIIHLVDLGLKVRTRIKEREDAIIDEVASDHLANGPPEEKQKGAG